MPSDSIHRGLLLGIAPGKWILYLFLSERMTSQVQAPRVCQPVSTMPVLLVSEYIVNLASTGAIDAPRRAWPLTSCGHDVLAMRNEAEVAGLAFD